MHGSRQLLLRSITIFFIFDINVTYNFWKSTEHDWSNFMLYKIHEKKNLDKKR